jgi:hypothetical protein
LEILGALGTVHGRHVNEFEPSGRCISDTIMDCSSRLHLWEAGCWRASGEVDEFASMRDGFGNSDRNSWRAHRGI